MADSNITAERVRELFQYQEKGQFIRRVRVCYSTKVGEVAGSITAKGYIYIKVDSRGYMAHRLAFLYMTGQWPKGQIDHINGDRSDNRWSNLREATPGENSQNRRNAARGKKSCDLLGVTWAPKLKKWVAQIMIEGNQNRLGAFDTPESAHEVYLEAKRRLHPYGML